MTKTVPAIVLLLLAACAQPVAENAATANIADAEITEVPDESGDAVGMSNESDAANETVVE